MGTGQPCWLAKAEVTVEMSSAELTALGDSDGG